MPKHEAHEPRPCSECYALITETLELTEKRLRNLSFKRDYAPTGLQMAQYDIDRTQIEEEIEYLKKMQEKYDA